MAHLGLRPPAALAPVLEADGAADGAAALEASLQLGAGAEGAAEGAAGSAAAAGLDAFGRAVVACLAQLAVTAGSDAQWKPLNHQVTACGIAGRAARGCRVAWQMLPALFSSTPSWGLARLDTPRPAHLQVLMMTRSLEPRTRLLALETVAQVRGGLWSYVAAHACVHPTSSYSGLHLPAPHHLATCPPHEPTRHLAPPSPSTPRSWLAGCLRSTWPCCPRRCPSWRSCWRTLSWRWR